MVIDHRDTLAHHAALMVIGFEVPAGFNVLHTCDNPPCVRNDDIGVYVVNGVAHPRFGHLWVGTHTDNVADKVFKNRQHRGENFPQSSLTESAIRAIRKRYAAGESQRHIAREYGVSASTIGRIVLRQGWKHVT